MASGGRSWVRGRPIGNGSFGAVSLAFDESTGGAFAVKSVAVYSSSRASVLALENEISVLKSLASPHVVAYLGDDTTCGGCRNLHMELMPGGTLADLSAARMNFPVDEEEVRAYARCVARALRYLHAAAGVVHCDVKGRNVLLGRAPGVAKLADFGAAVRISDDAHRPGARGTPPWMAPEVARGERPRPAADVWSLGCTVIEMATGEQPWPELKSKEAEAAMFRIGYGGAVPEFPAQLSKLGRDFLDKCLKREASERWTAEQLLEHPFLAESGGSAVGTSPRGVLEWASSGFGDYDGDGEHCTGVWDSIELIDCGRGRVRELASSSSREIANWEGEGWEDVRRAEEDLNLEEEEEEEGDEEECSVPSPSSSSRSWDVDGALVFGGEIESRNWESLFDRCGFFLFVDMILCYFFLHLQRKCHSSSVPAFLTFFFDLTLRALI